LNSNNLQAAGGKALAEGLKGNQVITELDISSNNLGVTSGVGTDMTWGSGVIALADIIPDMGALSFLNLSENNMHGADAGKALGNALAANTVLKELVLSGGKDRHGRPVPHMTIAFMKAFTPGLSDNGALTSLNLANNSLGELVPPEGWTKKTGGIGSGSPIFFKHADGREQKQDPGSKPEGIIAIASAIPDMGALTSLNLSSNDLKAEGAKIVAKAIKVANCAIAYCSRVGTDFMPI
jgi:Leucine-rich repeat (LRR) protein